MRILLVAVLTLFCGHQLLAQHIDEEVLAGCNTSCSQPKVWVGVELLNWMPHMRGLDFAIAEDGTSLTLGSGEVHEVEFDREVGIRTQLGFNTSVGWAVEFGYTHFGSEGSKTVERPAGTGQLFSTYSHPGGPEEADIATGSASLDYNVFDVNARYSVVNRQFIGLDLFGGFRWADINNQIQSRLDGRDFVNGAVDHESEVNAFGIRFGGQSHWRMASGFSITGGVAAAALYGKFDSHRLETNFGGAQTLVDLSDDYVQPVFNLETSLGLAWQRNNWHLSGGYEFNIWTNLGDNLRFVDDIEEGSFTALPGDLLLEGFFLRVAKAW